MTMFTIILRMIDVRSSLSLSDASNVLSSENIKLLHKLTFSCASGVWFSHAVCCTPRDFCHCKVHIVEEQQTCDRPIGNILLYFVLKLLLLFYKVSDMNSAVM